MPFRYRRRFPTRSLARRRARAAPRKQLAPRPWYKPTPNGPVVAQTYNPVANVPVGFKTRLTQQMQMQMCTAGGALFTTSTVANTYFGVVFAISDVSSAAILSVFDQYRIDVIEIWAETISPQGTTVFNTWGSAVDLDDVGPPTTAEQVAHKQGALISSGSAGHYHKFVPRIAPALYSGAFTSFGVNNPQWIDAASPNVQHYGVKFYSLPTNAAYTFNYRTRITFSVRGPGVA